MTARQKTNLTNSGSVGVAYRARQQQTQTPNSAIPPSLARLCRLCGGTAPAAPDLGACEVRCFARRMRGCRGARSCLWATRWPPGSGLSRFTFRCELHVRSGNGAAKFGGPAERQRGAAASRGMARVMGAQCEDRRAFVGRLGARRWQVSCAGISWLTGSAAAGMTAGHYYASKE